MSDPETRGVFIYRSDAGIETDVTDAVQGIYDIVQASMDFGSGFLDTDEIRTLRVVQRLAGYDEFRYESDICATCGHQRDRHVQRVDLMKACYGPRGTYLPDPPCECSSEEFNLMEAVHEHTDECAGIDCPWPPSMT